MIVSETEPEIYRSTAVAANIHLQKQSSEAQNTVAVAIPTVYSAGTKLNTGIRMANLIGGFHSLPQFP
jgi:hypothetical protein